MPLKATGFSTVLTALRNAGANVRLFGKISTDDFATETNFTSGNQTINWASGSPSEVNATTWRLESDINNQTVFSISTASGKIRITGLELLNASNEVLLNKSFGQTYQFNVNGEFTLEQLTIEAQ